MPDQEDSLGGETLDGEEQLAPADSNANKTVTTTIDMTSNLTS